MSDTDRDALLTPGQLVNRWQCQRLTLWRMRKRGDGPAFIRIGRLVRYRLCDVIAWERQHAVAKEEL